ncbi:molecular chaperone Hsp33 [Streptococcus mitis 17/34]|nr:molecular chaperone Hsp33 [Streptococcus mitis 17/34]
MKIGQIQPFPSNLLNTFVTPFIFYLKHSINLTNAEIICFSFYFHADFLVHYPENQQTHGSPFGHFYAKIVAMDKIIKTISESGAFRAFVLDSTETVRTAQEKHQTQASSTVALGRTLIASQILAANEKGNTKLTVKVLGSSSLGAIITVADTKGNVKGYVQNPGVDIKKTATGEVLVGPFVGNGQFLVITDYGIGNPYNSMTPLISGEIGEDLAFYLTESQQTPSAVGLNVLLDEEDKIKVAGGFLVQVLPGAKEEEIARFEKRIQAMPAISTLLESDDHIEALLKAIYGDEAYKRLSEEEIRFQCDCSHERFMNALASLPSSDLQEMKEEDHGAEITCQFCQTTYNFDENDLEELIRDKS